jgi:hypothetical protein
MIRKSGGFATDATARMSDKVRRVIRVEDHVRLYCRVHASQKLIWKTLSR